MHFVLGFGQGCKIHPDDFDECAQGESKRNHADDSGDQEEGRCSRCRHNDTHGCYDQPSRVSVDVRVGVGDRSHDAAIAAESARSTSLPTLLGSCQDEVNNGQ